MPAASTAPSSDQVLVGSSGTVYVGPTTITAPTAHDTAVDALWVQLGYVTEDGISIKDSKDVTELKAWQTPYPTRRLVTGRMFEVSFSLEQWNWNNIPFAFGGGYVIRLVQVITMNTFDSVDSFKLTWNGAEGATVFTRGTNATAAALQTALRAQTGDTSLTVSGTTDAGPFTVTFTVPSLASAITVTSPTGGCTGTVTGTTKFGFQPPDADDIDQRSLMIDWLDGTKIYRLYMKKGIVTEQVETNIKRTDAAVFPIVFASIADGTTSPYQLFTNDPAFEVA